MARRNRYVARKPRHQAAQQPGVWLVVEPVAPSLSEPIEVELVDLSRGGVRFRSDVPLSVGETIRVRLEDAGSGLELNRQGTVRWTKAVRPGIWSMGCRFFEPVDWETLGELFLNDVLSTDPPQSRSASSAPAAPDPPAPEACGDASWISSDA